MYYPCSEKEGADRLCCYCEAGLGLCFRLCKNLVFSWRVSCITITFVVYYFSHFKHSCKIVMNNFKNKLP